MKKHRKSLFLGAAASLMLLGACNDNLTGQDGEPTGPLKVLRLTLIDFGINTGHLVFTDTSAVSYTHLDVYKRQLGMGVCTCAGLNKDIHGADVAVR